MLDLDLVYWLWCNTWARHSLKLPQLCKTLQLYKNVWDRSYQLLAKLLYSWQSTLFTFCTAFTLTMSWLWLSVFAWWRGFPSSRSYIQTGYHNSFSNLNYTDLQWTAQKNEGRVAFYKRLDVRSGKLKILVRFILNSYSYPQKLASNKIR